MTYPTHGNTWNPHGYGTGDPMTCPACGISYVGGHMCKGYAEPYRPQPQITQYVTQISNCTVCGTTHVNTPCPLMAQLLDLMQKIAKKLDLPFDK